MRIPLFLILLTSAFQLTLSAQSNEFTDTSTTPNTRFDIQFTNKQITDILLSLGALAGKTVLPDETVTGTGSYYFAQASFDEALEIVLTDNALYAQNRNDVIHISKVFVSGNTASLTVHTEETSPDILLRRVSRGINTTILFDPLNRTPISVHMENVPIEQLLQVVLSRNPQFTLESSDGFYYLRNTPATQTSRQQGQTTVGQEYFSINNDNLISVNIENARVSSLLKELFQKTEKEFLFQKRGDGVIDRLYLQDKSFETVLSAVLSLSDSYHVIREDGIYIILDTNREEIIKRYSQVHQLYVTSMPVQEIPGLIPSGLGSSASFRLDKMGNSIILFGSSHEINPIADFIASIDKPVEGFRYIPIHLSFIKAQELIQLLPPRYKIVDPIVHNSKNMILLYLPDQRVEEAMEMIQQLDLPVNSYHVRLRYIQSTALLEALPPGVAKESVIKSPDPRIVFFQGSQRQFEEFNDHLQIIDTPTPQIRYQLLVIQYQNKHTVNINPGFQVGKPEADQEQNWFLGSVGRLLNVNFDILSTFGYAFAIDLTAGIEDSTAHIVADTTLTAISGQEVSFQNTNTFRYRDPEKDEATGEIKTTGVTREIVSGLLLKISGWVSGNNMVTMDISTTVSKRGSVSESSTGNPPPTSEKVVTTHIRTTAGTPVIISGLVQQDFDYGTNKTPLVGDVPVLGELFKSQNSNQEDTEMVMYIVPYIDIPEAEDDANAIMQNYYTQHFGGSSGL